MVSGSRDLLRVRLEDGAERAITRTPSREESWPYWSEPAGRLVFQVTRGPGLSDLMQWSASDGEGPLAVTPRDERWPVWSPVAARLAYTFVGGKPRSGLALIEMNTGKSLVLADAGPDHIMLRPSWAPDGSQLLVQRRPREGGASRLWRVRPDESPHALLEDAAWSDTKGWFTRDGTRIVFTREPADGGLADVWIVTADGSGARVLAGGPDTREHSGRPSPTRDELAFVSDRGGSPQIWLAGLDGAGARQITTTLGGAFTPRWSPDGELLVISMSATVGKPRLADRESLEGLRLLVIDRDGRRHFETPGFMPDWMPAWR